MADQDLTDVPAYLLAADNHNIGNSKGGSWFDPETWGDKFAGAGKLIASGMLSGANSFYNTGAYIGNAFGVDAEQRDTKAWISSIDEDLGAYYSENRGAADLVGFLAGSLIPGMAGVKFLNAGQTALKAAAGRGVLGSNLSRATGLLVPETEMYITAAAKDITSAGATFSSINVNTLKALGAGVWQNTLEGAAFETAVQATMFKSPILQEQDRWDIVKNIAVGGALGGVIGGAFEGARTFARIKKAIGVEDLRVKPFGSRDLAEQGALPSDALILMSEDLAAARATQLAAGDLNAAKALEDRVRRTQNAIREESHKLVPGNQPEIGNMIADVNHGAPPATVLQNFLHVEEVTSVKGATKVETEIKARVKKGEPTDDLQVSYMKTHGDNAGQVTTEAPAVISLADHVRPTGGQSVREAVLGAVRDYGFKAGKSWDVREVSGLNPHLEAEARNIWAHEIFTGWNPEKAFKIGQYDLPLLERLWIDSEKAPELLGRVQLTGSQGEILKDGFLLRGDLLKHIQAAKEEAAYALLESKVFTGAPSVARMGNEGVARMVNMRLSRLEDEVREGTEDYFAWQTANKEYENFLAARGLRTPANPIEKGQERATPDTRFLPSYAKITKRVRNMDDLDGNVMDGMTFIKTQQKLIRDAVNNAVAKALPAGIYEKIPEIPDSLILTANRHGAGAGLASFSNGNYGSLESILQFVGSLTKEAKTAFRKETQAALEGPLFNLLSKQDVAIEFETLNQKVSRAGKLMVRATDDMGNEYLVPRDALTAATKDGVTNWDELLDAAGEMVHEIKHPETVALVDAHIARTGDRTATHSEVRAAQGMTDSKDPGVFRPIRPNPKDYPFFAFVKDPRVTGQGHATMLFANSEAKLQAQIDMVRREYPEYSVLTKREVEDFKRARQEYEYQRTLNESYIDSNLKSKGIFSNFLTRTDPRTIADSILQQHLREDDMLAIELMRAKNSKTFDWLEDQGQAYTKVAASKFGSYGERLEAQGTNPYLDYIKTALDISKVSEHPWLYGFNKLLDGAVSRAYGHLEESFKGWKNPYDEAKITEINALLKANGMDTAYSTAADILLANHPAPKGELTKFIRGANALLSKLTLGLDPLNAVNNFVGANVLRGTELNQITRAIKEGNSEIAGELAKLAKIDVPGGVGQILSPSKLVAQAMTNFLKDDGTLLAKYKAAGFVKDASTQFKQILDDFTLQGTESVSELKGRLARAFEKAKALSETGEKLTGNKLAEELNRFISANVADQITSLGVKHGVLSNQEALAYINTFVNRVEGNTIASQRPLMFQGPVGQAIGLFQSYQFNLMQQLFRYVGEGSGKDTAMLLGLQGTFYGLQGLPAFQFINQHVVGTMSGNQKHVDLYDATYGVAGKQAGDWLMYGLPSNLLQANLYSRGDINPRQVTVVPATLADVPIVGAFGKFFGSIKATADKIGAGGQVWESMLQGLEHNGLSRPLAGLAQTLQAFGEDGQVYSTTSKGTILASNDLMSWATATRLAGGRPLDEAITNDGVYRIHAYQQFDRAKMQTLAGAIKSASIMGNKPDEDSVVQFAKHYAASGGKQVNFNKYMMNEMKAANTAESQRIVSQLQNPFAQKMQVLMGGSESAFNSLTD